MSRCFPYPPPGYEPRPRRSEHKNLLKKERQKGKKHGKENGREKGDRRGKDRRKGDRKGKDRDHKKLKRGKRRERRRSKDRDKDSHQSAEQRTQKTDDFDNRRHEGRTKNEVAKDIKCSDELVAQLPGQGGNQNHKVHSTSELIPGRSEGFGATASKEKENSFSRMVKKSGHPTQHYHDMIRKNDNNAYANKKGIDAGVDFQTKIKNGKNLQVGSGEKHSSRRQNSKVKQMKRSGDLREQNKADDLMHLACFDEQKFACGDIKKRKELDANSTFPENSIKTTKLPRVTPYSSTEQVGANTQEVGWHKPQDGYSNGITGSRYLEQQKISVSSSVDDSKEGYLEPPHPDTKHLSQLLSIPPREDIPECIDQDWLFSEGRVQRNTATSEAAESHQVWSDARLIDAADVVALPYVVPL